MVAAAECEQACASEGVGGSGYPLLWVVSLLSSSAGGCQDCGGGVRGGQERGPRKTHVCSRRSWEGEKGGQVLGQKGVKKGSRPDFDPILTRFRPDFNPIQKKNSFPTAGPGSGTPKIPFIDKDVVGSGEAHTCIR